MVDFTEEEYELMHIGIKRRSGRYPWGSGAGSRTEYGRSRNFKSYIEELTEKNPGITDPQIAKYISEVSGTHFSTTDLRAATAISTEVILAENKQRATYLRNRGYSHQKIAELMGLQKSAESTVRGWLKDSDTYKANSLRATAETLKEMVEKKPFLDVGKGTWLYMGITETKLKTALAMLVDEGYVIHPVKVPQLGTENMTRLKILCKEGVSWAEARAAVIRGELRTLTAQSDDNGMTFRTPKDLPVSVNSKRIAVRYKEDGGGKMDGVIELRRGVPDLDLGTARYGQVRIAVDGTHYLKGMAMYADDLPAGVDIRFNTPKSKTTEGGKVGVMKPLNTKKEDGSIDPDNPFGATTHPRVYLDKNGKEQTSSLNIVGSKESGNIEGRWDAWSKNLSSQMLSKQPLALASRQLGLAQKQREEELKEIMALTNPVVKRKLLEEYADSADSAAVHLKAAQMERQSTHVILPMNSMRVNEIYAPNFNNGEKVVLVRHPHGGPFEIPELTVNLKNLTAKRLLGNAADAVGIHHSVAEQLSGADFDGDTVLVIPNDSGRVKTRPPLKGLEGFDPKMEFPETSGMKYMSKLGTQNEMGKISNLITDMSIHKAPDDELARAIRHSMVVIDAEKHKLNYKLSEQVNNISQLKDKYQKDPVMNSRGASTLISRASSDIRIPEQKLRSYKDGGPVDPKTGALVWEPTGDTKTKVSTKTYKRTGETITTVSQVPKLTKGTRMEFAKDARELLSGTGPLATRGQPIERVYADYANNMKALANLARKENTALRMPTVSTAAKHHYANEVESLTAKLKVAQRNAPLERRAQVIGNSLAKARIDADPTLDKDSIKKIKYQSLEEARIITGAAKQRVVISDREWEAIQSHALPHSKLSEIFLHSDMERVKELATPRTGGTSLTPGQLARARQMQLSNRPMSEIAAELGIPRSTLVDNLAR